jgi:hypothetical protein
MSHHYLDDECYKCRYYTRFLTDSAPWTCEVCHLVEAGFIDANDPSYDIIWGRYLLECGHQAHLRCLRKWCKEVEYVGCPCCGPIEEVESKQFCDKCVVFGHASKTCPL